MKRPLFALILLAAPALSFGQTPPVTPPVTPPAPQAAPQAVVSGAFFPSQAQPGVQTGEQILGVFIVDASASVSDKPVRWHVKGPTLTLTVATPAARPVNSLATAYPTTPGTYTFKAVASGTIDGERDADAALFTYTVPDPKPAPPVTPPVNPTPVTPVTPVAPTTIGNMRVLVLYDSGAAMSAPQRNVLFSTTSVIPYLNAKCMKGADGRAGWRFLDPTTPMAGDAGEWQDLMTKAKADTVAIPKIVVFAGNTIAGLRMVTSEADALSYLQSLGGK